MGPNDERHRSEALAEQARELHQSGNFKEAFDCVNTAIEVDPENAYAYVVRGGIYAGAAYGGGDSDFYVGAVRDLERAESLGYDKDAIAAGRAQIIEWWQQSGKK